MPLGSIVSRTRIGNIAMRGFRLNWLLSLSIEQVVYLVNLPLSSSDNTGQVVSVMTLTESSNSDSTSPGSVSDSSDPLPMLSSSLAQKYSCTTLVHTSLCTQCNRLDDDNSLSAFATAASFDKLIFLTWHAWHNHVRGSKQGHFKTSHCTCPACRLPRSECCM